MPGPNSFDTPETPAQNRQRVAAALELAYQLRKELMARPLPPAEPQEQPIYRLIHYVDPAKIEDALPAPRDTAAPKPPQKQSPGSVTVDADEMKRLQRIVNMLTTAMGELNLWLINAGRDVQEIQP